MSHSTGWLVLPVTLAVILAISGVAKLRAPGSTHSVLVLLDLPGFLRTRMLARILPWVEFVVAALLVATPSGPAYVVSALIALGLFAAYWLVVARALRFEHPPTCGCFGRIGDQRIQPRTLLRNSVYLLAALGTLALALAGGSVPGLLSDAGGDDLVWLLTAALAVAMVVLSFVPYNPRPKFAGAPAEPTLTVVEDPEEDPEAYVRAPNPVLPVLDGEQATTLSDLARTQALLLVWDPDDALAEQFPGWRAALPALGVRRLAPAGIAAGAGADPGTGVLVDHSGTGARMLGCDGGPCGVLLGADGLLAGGPVTGEQEIEEFVAQIAAELSGIAPPPDPADRVSSQPGGDTERHHVVQDLQR